MCSDPLIPLFSPGKPSSPGGLCPSCPAVVAGPAGPGPPATHLPPGPGLQPALEPYPPPAAAPLGGPLAGWPRWGPAQGLCPGGGRPRQRPGRRACLPQAAPAAHHGYARQGTGREGLPPPHPCLTSCLSSREVHGRAPRCCQPGPERPEPGRMCRGRRVRGHAGRDICGRRAEGQDQSPTGLAFSDSEWVGGADADQARGSLGKALIGGGS